jgi:preprotein translocase subunit SecA
MTLFKQWTELMESQTEETFEAFWEEYSGAETKIYQHILANKDTHLAGTVKELAEKFEVREVIFMGFLDGINTSLNNPNELEKLASDTAIDLDIDFEKLFFNMLVAEADYLYGLEEWADVLPEEKLIEIIKEYKKSKTVHVEKKPGRNEPCPCGSGKKYKKCCGK